MISADPSAGAKLPVAPKQARGAERVESLLDAAAALVAEHGPTGFPFREVARRARTAQGSLYQFFPSREAVLVALHERYAGQAVDLAELAIADAQGATDTEGVANAGGAAQWCDALAASIVKRFLPFYRDAPGYGAIRHWAVSNDVSRVEDDADARIVAELATAIAAHSHQASDPARIAQTVIEIADALLPLAALDHAWVKEAERAIAAYLKDRLKDDR